MANMQAWLRRFPVFAYFVVALTVSWADQRVAASAVTWHALFDFFSGSQATDGLMNGVMSTLLVVWAIGILVAPGRKSLWDARHGEHHVGDLETGFGVLRWHDPVPTRHG
jgi:hypothetical protein